MGGGIARSGGKDTVHSLTGTGTNCASPLETVTGTGSTNVLVNDYGVVREGDTVGAHASGIGGTCSGTDTSTLTTYSSTVFVNDKGIGCNGDKYTSDNTITSGSTDVFSNQN